ncbi:unnamed protein product [Clavelina lepadiformis]|uniref:Uncharacterized protein n=1 Tax=Clavelina lepadiformis TaxID=159417 RepID=A0ABP0GLM5_CLALP
MSVGSGEAESPTEQTLAVAQFVPQTDDNTSHLDVVSTVAHVQSSTFGNLDDAPKDFKSVRSAPSLFDVKDEIIDRLGTESSLALNSTLTPDTTTPESNQMVLIIGVTCGVIGLLIGIAITAILWIYTQKRKRKNGQMRSRHASVLEKNPKEKTFEPLDLSLTLPSYAHNSSNTLDKRKSLSEMIGTNDSTPKLNNRFSDRSEENDSSYQGFEPPVPPLPSNDMYRHDGFLPTYTNDDRLSEITDDRSYVGERYSNHDNHELNKSDLPELAGINLIGSKTRYGAHYKNGYEPVKRPTSIATRDSFSSGLGTGTESDTLPCEGRRSATLPMAGGRDYPYDLPGSERPRYVRKKSSLGVVREGHPRRSKKPGGNKRRPARVSDASSGTNDWSSTDTSYSPASTLPSTTDSGMPFSTPLASTATIIDEEEARRQTNRSKDWYNSDSSDENNGWPKEDKKGSEGQEESPESGEVLSKYFNMHFPPTPMITRKEETEQKKVTLPEVNEEPHPITLIRHNSDLTINL